jgi:hypothetical protein
LVIDNTPRANQADEEQSSLVYGKFDPNPQNQKLTVNGILGSTQLPVYANNSGAIAGGLNVGDFYRTGADPDLVCVVH